MKRILGIAFALSVLSSPAWSVCPATLQLKDNAGTTANGKYTDDGSGNCQANIAVQDGGDVTKGAKADTAYAGSGSASIVSILKGLCSAITSPIPAGTNNIGKVTPNDGTNSVIFDPCQTVIKSNVAISQATSTQIIPGTSSKKTYICSIFIVGADAESISLVEGTGLVCATGTAAVIGGTTAATGPNFSANNGWAQGNGYGTIAAALNTAADNLCLLQSGTGRVAGNITYVQQ